MKAAGVPLVAFTFMRSDPFYLEIYAIKGLRLDISALDAMLGATQS